MIGTSSAQRVDTFFRSIIIDDCFVDFHLIDKWKQHLKDISQLAMEVVSHDKMAFTTTPKQILFQHQPPEVIWWQSDDVTPTVSSSLPAPSSMQAAVAGVNANTNKRTWNMMESSTEQPTVEWVLDSLGLLDARGIMKIVTDGLRGEKELVKFSITVSMPPATDEQVHDFKIARLPDLQVSLSSSFSATRMLYSCISSGQ